MHTLEFFFDCSSPWTYLAFESVQKTQGAHRLQHRLAADSRRRRLQSGQSQRVRKSCETGAGEGALLPEGSADWAHYVGITIGQPPVFPVNSVKAMRGAFVAIEHDCLEAYARRVFHRYWGDLADISQDDVLSGIVSACGLPVDEFFDKIGTADLQGSFAHQHRRS